MDFAGDGVVAETFVLALSGEREFKNCGEGGVGLVVPEELMGSEKERRRTGREVEAEGGDAVSELIGGRNLLVAAEEVRRVSCCFLGVGSWRKEEEGDRLLTEEPHMVQQWAAAEEGGGSVVVVLRVSIARRLTALDSNPPCSSISCECSVLCISYPLPLDFSLS